MSSAVHRAAAVALPRRRHLMKKTLSGAINLTSDNRYSVSCLQTWGKYRHYNHLSHPNHAVVSRRGEELENGAKNSRGQSAPLTTQRTRWFQTSLSLGAMEIRMPSLSPTMTEGTIVEWHKEEGDSVAPGDVLCDIQTDKAVMGFELEEEGVLAKILVPRDAKNVQIGELIAILAEEGEDISSIRIPSAASSPPPRPAAPAASAPAPPPPPAAPAPASAGVPSVNVGMILNMPSLSPTMNEGTIVEWLKKEGDEISPGDLLCEIQTDKAVMGFELEEEGFLAKILVPLDAKAIIVGQPIAVIVENKDDVAKVSVSTGAAAASTVAPHAAASAAPLPPAAPAPASAGVPSVNVGMILNMPSLSPTMNEGTIVEWLKKEGDEISPGDLLCEIQTDKAVMGFELEEEGFLAKILVPLDAKAIIVGQPIAVIVENKDDVAKVSVTAAAAAPPLAAAAPAAAPAAPPVAHAPTVAPVAAAAASPKIDVYSGQIEKYGPAVRMLLYLYGLDEAKLPRTGRKGWLLKTDVLDYIHQHKLVPQPQHVPLPSMLLASPPASPAAAASKAKSAAAAKAAAAIGSVATPYQDLELTSMRKTIAKRLTESKTTIPHAYAVMDCSMDSVLSLRKSLKEKKQATVSVNDFVIKAVALALKRVPSVNAVWDASAGEGQIQPSVDISVAVATPGGLITPIVKDAFGAGLQDIADTVRTLAGKAREGKLQPHEFIGGSFSISNLGMFGVSEFSAVINPPQAGILAIGGSRIQPGLDGEPETMMKVTLSYDARIVEDDKAFQFLEAFRDALENPMSMI